MSLSKDILFGTGVEYNFHLDRQDSPDLLFLLLVDPSILRMSFSGQAFLPFLLFQYIQGIEFAYFKKIYRVSKMAPRGRKQKTSLL
jgi:hypothetical protein